MLYLTPEIFFENLKKPCYFLWQAKNIAKSGQEFARNNLMGDHIFCYYFKLFQVGMFLTATTTKTEVPQKEFRATELLETGQSSSWSYKSSSSN